MAANLETVVKQLEDSGIISPGKLENFIPPKASPKTAEELVKELVKNNHLTEFQARHVNAGKTKSLILGNYTILDKIGAGGMGQVFKAEHRRMHRVVAIKMLPPAMTKDAAALARFEREVTAAAKLSHPNIVAAYDADEANGAHFLVMEYVEGKDLSVMVKKNGPFSVAKAVNFTLQAAKGLEFAHKKGVIHRDIKPANLLLDSEGTVKILDMGLARIESEGGPAQAELTGTGTIMGTVDYMAPEQGMSTKHADARADIYSLGCSLYYLLSGKPTYGGETVAAKLVAHHNHPIPSLREVQADLPEQLEATFKKMVAKRIEDRYQTMSEVVADLEKCQSAVNAASTSSTSVWNPTTTTAGSGESEVTSFFGNQKLKRISEDPFEVQEPAKKERRGKKAAAGIPPWKNPKLLIGAAAGFLAVLLGVIVIIRNDKGEEIARVESQQGTSVEVRNSPLAAGGRGRAASSTERTAAEGAKSWESPAFQQWVKEVQALPAAKQVEAVSKKLMELNPGFDGKLTPKIDADVVVELKFLCNEVSDISPVRALHSLQVLNCSGGPADKGKLSDLSPLSGMRLTNLTFSVTRVTDLSPLGGMPLESLACGGSDVADLSPLAGMTLKNLSIPNTNVADLSQLKGMQLQYLGLGHTTVSDISIVRGMPLMTLDCRYTPVANLSPLLDCKMLAHLDCGSSKVTAATVATLQKALPNCKIEWDGAVKASKPWESPAFQAWIKQVQAMPAEKQVEAVSKKLMELNPEFDGKLNGSGGSLTPKVEKGVVSELGFYTDNVTDLSPVRALSGLQVLRCAGSATGKGRLSDLSPLNGMQLTNLICSYNPVSTFSMLQGMPLKNLSFNNTLVSNLSDLRGTDLAHLDFGSAPVSDLSPLRGTKLQSLNCSNTNVASLLPLQGMPLKSLFAHRTQISDLSPLQECKGLTALNIGNTKVTLATVAALQKALPNCKIEWDDPAKVAKPWENPAFQAWMKEVQAMPAEKQVEAVSKKLMELNPGFDGKVTGADGKGIPKIENGVVTVLGFNTGKVADISPVRAFARLKHLDCSGSYTRNGELSDLSPVQGTNLVELTFYHTQVSDLSPLQGIRLSFLGCSHTRISDLSPLQGMSNLRFLDTRFTNVTPAGVAALQKALPNCKIEWDDPAKPKTPAPAPSGTK